MFAGAFRSLSFGQGVLNTLHVTCTQTLERAYLLKLGGRVLERPQYMFMRIAIGIHGEDLEARMDGEFVRGGNSVSNGTKKGLSVISS